MASVELQEGACYAQVTASSLALDACAALVADDAAGAVATFTGVTRNSFQGKAVLWLEYEAYLPMAAKKLLVSPAKQHCDGCDGGRPAGSVLPRAVTATRRRRCCLQELCQEACRRWALCKVAIAHRTGRVGVGEASVLIAASSAHRREALEVRQGWAGGDAWTSTCCCVPRC